MHRVLGVLKSFVQKWIHHGSEQLPGAWICTEKKTLCFSSTKWPTLKTKHKSTAVEHLRFGVFEIFPHVFTNQRVWIKKQILPEATRWDFTKFDKQVCLFSMIKKELMMVQSANFHPKIVGSKFPWIFWPARKVGYHNFICLADRLQSSFCFRVPGSLKAMSFFDLFSAWTCGTCTVTESRPEKEVPEAVLQEANDKEEEILPGPVLHPLRNIEESQKMLEVKVEVEKKPAKKLQESPDTWMWVKI